MEDSRFDDLTRALARPRSRRGFLAGAAAFAAGVFGGRVGTEAAPSCRGAGHPCEGNQTCCDGLVCVVSGPGNATRCTPCPAGQIACGGVCIPACTALDQCHVAGVCDPATQSCTNPAKADGDPCNDGDACTQTDTCQGGVCRGDDPVVCTPQDQCHVAGVCDPATGACTNPNAPDGTGCNDGNACTNGDTCQAGICRGGAAVVCPNDNPCMDVFCNPASGCVQRPKPPGISCDADSNACTVGDACDGQGNCRPGQLRMCPPCQRCNTFDGICVPDPIQDGRFCPGDGNQCFGAFRCNFGNCVGVDPVVCTPQDQCHRAGVCDPANGICSNPDLPDGAICNDGNACTRTDICRGGVCRGDNPVVCPAPGQCHTQGTCNPATGVCSNPLAPVGTDCDDDNPCTVNDACRADGTCAGTPNPCNDNNACTTDTCNPATGCVHTTISCDDGNECTADVCDRVGGCINDPGPLNGRPCGGGTGTCRNGACDPNGCANAVLSGGPSPATPLTVDDDLRVDLRGATVFNEDDEASDDIPPIALGAVANGDPLRVIASNTRNTNICGGASTDSQSLSPLYLHCIATGEVQVLDADGHPNEDAGGCGVTFYDTIFTVAL